MRFANKLIEENGVAKLESPPKLQEGKKMIIIISTKQKEIK
jgi:predicted DNA-binding antitoxin AbrB/MazE fold protein